MWFCHQPLMHSSSHLMKMHFLSSSVCLWGLDLSPHDVPKPDRVPKQFPAAWASLGTRNVTLGLWVLRLLRKKSAVGGSLCLMTARSFPSLSVAQLIFFLFLKATLQPSCETPVGVQWHHQSFSTAWTGVQRLTVCLWCIGSNAIAFPNLLP